jgi:hypothetical protein
VAHAGDGDQDDLGAVLRRAIALVHHL